jgi:hypothetical protein
MNGPKPSAEKYYREDLTMIFGHYFQLDQSDFQELTSHHSRQDELLKSDDFDQIYQGHYFIGDLWQAIDFLLTGEELPASSHPLHQLVYGGNPLNDYEPAQIMGPFRHFDSSKVIELVALLDPIEPENLVENYNTALMLERAIHPHVWNESDADEMKDLIKECYAGLRDFFKEAAKKGNSIIVFITA